MEKNGFVSKVHFRKPKGRPMAPAIYSTATPTKLTCWREDLGAPEAVAIATSGEWNNTNQRRL